MGEKITASLTQIWSLADGAVEFITGNDLLMIFLTAGLVGIGFRVFRKAKRTAM